MSCAHAGLFFSQAALESCLEEMSGKVEQVQAQRKALQAQIATMVLAHAADMDAMTQQLAESAGTLAAKEASVRCACLIWSDASLTVATM